MHAKTPIAVGLMLIKTEQKGNYDYRNLIGCLMYVAVCTRSDNVHTVSMHTQFNDCHSLEWQSLN